MADLNLLSEEVIAQLKLGLEQLKSRCKYLGKTAPYVQELADRGWFINGSHTPAFTIEALTFIKKKHFRKVDKLFEDYYLQALPEVEGRLKGLYPEITPMVKQAFKCFHAKLHFASIPLMLIISEYIANRAVSELTGQPLQNLLFNYNRSKGHYNIVDHIGEMVAEYKSIFGINQPLINKHLVNRDSRHLPPNRPTDLNRHLIIHGASTNYGTRRSNLKAVCFLEFVCLSIKELGFKGIP